MPTVTVYEEADTVRVELWKGSFSFCREFGDSRHVFYDTGGKPYAVEFMDAHEGIDLSGIPLDERMIGRLLEEHGYRVLATR